MPRPELFPDTGAALSSITPESHQGTHPEAAVVKQPEGVDAQRGSPFANLGEPPAVEASAANQAAELQKAAVLQRGKTFASGCCAVAVVAAGTAAVASVVIQLFGQEIVDAYASLANHTV